MQAKARTSSLQPLTDAEVRQLAWTASLSPSGEWPDEVAAYNIYLNDALLATVPRSAAAMAGAEG
jgi:hypothetical protein